MESTGAPGSPPPDEVPVPPAAAPPAPPAAPPPGPAPAAAASTSPAWINTITSSETVAGPGGMVYSDLPMRIFAYIIDAVILSAAFFLLFTILGAMFLGSLFVGGFGFGVILWFLVFVAAYFAISAVYFIYTWTRMRATFGQRILGLETVNAGDGATLTQPQAIRRYVFLFGPSVLATALSIIGFLGNPGVAGLAGRLRLLDLPPLHRGEQRHPPGLPRRPGEHGCRQDQALTRPRGAPSRDPRTDRRPGHRPGRRHLRDQRATRDQDRRIACPSAVRVRRR